MSGGGSSFDSGASGSVFASSNSAAQQPDDTGSSQLDLLAEGAAAYDGTVPTGEESGGDGGDGGVSPALSGQGAASSRARFPM